MAVCPQCGGSDRRLLAPGYFECTSHTERVVDLAPAASHGGSGDIPIYGTFACGARYQASDASANIAQCACGMFAVGACSECGDPLCGEHVLKVDGRVLCPTHAPAAAQASRKRARAEAQAEDRRRRQEAENKLAEASAAVEREAAARYAAAPSFPTAPATGPELAAALDRLVPHKTDWLLTQEAGWLRKASYAEGWIFFLKKKPHLEPGSSGATLCDTHVLIVMADGRMFEQRMSVVAECVPDRIRPIGGHGGPVATVVGEELERVLDQVLHWLGALNECSIATREQHYEGLLMSGFHDEAQDEERERRLRLRP